ncbi:MAG: ABC transporter permease [Solirubrobacterales bacterium]
MSEASTLFRNASKTSIFWITVALAALVVFFGVASPAGTFLTSFNAQTIAADASVLLILATATTIVIISGGLDLSIGSVMTFAAVIGLIVMRDVGDSWSAVAVGTVVAIACGAGWGLINGLLISLAKIPPFVVTLGSLGAALGAARLITGGLTQSGVPSVLSADIGNAEVIGIPVPFLIGIAVACVAAAIMAYTRFGEHVYLLGSNEEGARRGGIGTRSLQVRIYVISGALASLAGVVELARFGTASVATGHLTELLAALAAVIIGGAALTGGSGLVLASVVGVFIPVVINNGLVIMGVQPFWQEIVVGAILVAAVGLDQVRRAGVFQRAATPSPEEEAPPDSARGPAVHPNTVTPDSSATKEKA